MTDYFEFLLDGNEIKDVAALSTQEQFDTFKRLKFLAMLKIKDSNLVARHSALKFICGNLNSEIHKMTTPQVRFDVTGGSLAVNEAKVSGTAFALNKTSGTISAGWTGEDFVTAQIILVFLSTMVGAVDLFLALEFLPHIKDR